MEICTRANPMPAFAIVPTQPARNDWRRFDIAKEGGARYQAESQRIQLDVTVVSDVPAVARERENAALLRQTTHGRSGDKDNVSARVCLSLFRCAGG
jgi:hypothetical protein